MRQISVMGHLPEFYSPVREFRRIDEIENAEFQELARCNEEDLRDAFIMTADERSLKIWEKEIGIRAEAGMETLDFRRKRLVNRYTAKPPFTMRWLEKQLAALLGAGFSHCERDEEVELLTVYADLSSLLLLREFEATIEQVLPLSMQHWKHLLGYRKPEGGFFVGGTTMGHVQLTSWPA